MMKMSLRMPGPAGFSDKLRGSIMKSVLEFIQDEMPLGVIVFDGEMRVIYHNRVAAKYLKRYGIVPELSAMAEKVFGERRAADRSALSKHVPFNVASKGLPRNLSVRYLYSEEPFPRISVFISTKPCNSQLNVEEVITRYNLTKKEGEVFRQLVRGLRNSDIALELHMQAHTLRDHLKSIYRKCGVTTKLELVRNIIA
jgi:DNA-binding CsgD family transcriptional regulator